MPVVLSLTAAVLPAQAQRRPRYGGLLRIEVRDRISGLDAPSPWFASVFETLVRLDEAGRPQPHLAVSWSHDPQRKRWIFIPRGDVKLHDGNPWAPPASSLSFPDNRPIGDLLIDLAHPRNAIIMRQQQGPPLGTGPFRINEWDPAGSLTLAAHLQHWRGRPFLDSIRILFNRVPRDQALDFELDRADIVEVPLPEVRRLRGPQLSTSAPSLLMALVLSRPIKGLSVSIDRSSIHSVLLQKQGEPAGSLLPQWFSGIAFLFPAGRDLNAARAISAAVPPLNFHFDTQDTLLRSIGERIVLNASEAGFRLNPSNSPNADVRLALIPLTSTNPNSALRDLAEKLGLPMPEEADLHSAERSLLDTDRVAPLFHLPAVHRVNRRVQHWSPFAAWPLADVWLDEAGVRP